MGKRPPALFCEPISFSPSEKEKGSRSQRKRELSKPEVHPVPPSCDSSFARFDLPAPNHLSAGNYAPHAILMMAVIDLPANTAKSKTFSYAASPEQGSGRLFPFLHRARRFFSFSE